MYAQGRTIPKTIPNAKKPPGGGFAVVDFVGVFGRSDRIRTYDPLVPNEVRYQAALHSDCTTHGVGEAFYSGAASPRQAPLAIFVDHGRIISRRTVATPLNVIWVLIHRSRNAKSRDNTRTRPCPSQSRSVSADR